MLPDTMNTYRFTNALHCTFAQLAEMHTISFRDYFFPMEMTLESTASMYRVYQVAPQHSIALHTEDSAFVGLAKLALRGSRAWCAGFGIAPAFRGKGMGKLLVVSMIEETRKAGAVTLQLEVLEQNVTALKLYSGAGFVITRQLVGLHIATSYLSLTPSALSTTPVELDSLLPSIIAQRQPDWEHELPSILATNHQALLTIGLHGSPVGLAYQLADASMRVLSATPSASTIPEDMAALLTAAATGVQIIQVYNEPESSVAFPFYKALGFQEFFRQYEMVLDLHSTHASFEPSMV
jgi:ribosomal protein S18 acetylase RimI-like enzyme